MSRAQRRTLWPLALLGLSLAVVGQTHAQDEQEARLQAALASPERSEDDRARDAARRPIQVIQFLGIEDGMTVLEVTAAGGWYTHVLSAAVGPDGKVYAQNPPFFAQREGFAEQERMRHEQLGNVEAVHGDLAQMELDIQADAAFSALNLHDTYNGAGEEAAVGLVRGVYNALRPGGVFGLIDHAGDEGQNNAEYHRMQVSQAREVLTQAGFEVEAESDILSNPADDRRRSIRDPSLERNSDRFLLKARKPE